MSTVSASDTAAAGTNALPFHPHIERNLQGNETDVFQSISAQFAYRNISAEELRHSYYKQGRGSTRANTAASASSGWPQLQKALTMESTESCKRLALLQGPGIEIRVGVSSTSQEGPTWTDDVTSHNSTWCLPRGLISRYSPVLKAACSDVLKKHQSRIELPEDDAEVFRLFVEWMIYGHYTLASPPFDRGLHNGISVNAQCWVLGDKLLCNEFKNYVMGRLYPEHTAIFNGKSITPDEVDYVCDNTFLESKLRRFYIDFLITHFDKEHRLVGSTEEWDEVALAHDDLRVRLLSSFRKKLGEKVHVKEQKEYLEPVGPLETAFQKLGVENNTK